MFEAFFLAQRIFVGSPLSLGQKKILVAHALNLGVINNKGRGGVSFPLLFIVW